MGNQYHRLGIFGGTFNPIHLGHLRLAEDVREEFFLDKVLFVPAARPPHKEMDVWIDPLHRLRMVEIAIEGNEHFLCDPVEVERGGVSYTIDTVKYVYEKYNPEKKPFLIIGSDLIPGLDSWKSVDMLIKMVNFIVINRDGYPFEGMKKGIIMNSSHYLYEKRKINIKSSEIRERLKSKRSIRYLVTDKVFQYIIENELYT
ncbi:MAG: nicotinate-nucleotide adenylyltransferase [Spirochaetota bacterium]